MIAGQNAKAAGKQRQAFMNAKFHGKIGNRILGSQGPLGAIGRIQNAALKLLLNAFEMGKKAFVL